MDRARALRGQTRDPVGELINNGFVTLADDRLYHVTPAGLTQAQHGAPFSE